MTVTVTMISSMPAVIPTTMPAGIKRPRSRGHVAGIGVTDRVNCTTGERETGQETESQHYEGGGFAIKFHGLNMGL